MADVQALDMDVVTEKSDHNVVGMAVSVCITPAAPSPLPLPYPLTATVAEGITDSPLRTKVCGTNCATIGSVLKTCHGNEPGTLKEVVSLNQMGPVAPITGAFTVLIELGPAAFTGSQAIMNKAPTPGVGSNASDAGGAGGGGGGAGAGGGGSGGPGGPDGPGGGGGGGGGSSTAAFALPGVSQKDRDLAASAGKSRDQIIARKKVAAAFMRQNGQTYKDKDADGKPYGKDASGKPIKKLRPLTHDERKSELACTNYNDPVVVGPPPPCKSPLYQYQAAGNDRGGYFAADKSTTPSQLGIGPDGKAWNQPGQPVVSKTQTPYTADPNTPYMQTTASQPPKGDFWSTPGTTQPATGGGQQTYVPSGYDPSAPNLT